LFLILITVTSGIFAQKKVTGTVLDTEKQPLIGANVFVKGTVTGMMTDVNGKFSITVPSSGSILSVSCIGYISKDVVVGNNIITMSLENFLA
jgi:hypothetical protein